MIFMKNIISCMWYITGWLWYYYLLYITCNSSTIFHINFIFNFHGNSETSFNYLESNQFFADSCFSQKFNWLLDIYFWLKKSDLGEKNCSDKDFSSYKKNCTSISFFTVSLKSLIFKIEVKRQQATQWAKKWKHSTICLPKYTYENWGKQYMSNFLDFLKHCCG